MVTLCKLAAWTRIRETGNVVYSSAMERILSTVSQGVVDVVLTIGKNRLCDLSKALRKLIDDRGETKNDDSVTLDGVPLD